MVRHGPRSNYKFIWFSQTPSFKFWFGYSWIISPPITPLSWLFSALSEESGHNMRPNEITYPVSNNKFVISKKG